MKKREIKPVSFSLIDEYEKKLLDHALQPINGAFGKYIKRLISRDMEGWEIRTVPSEVVEKSVNSVDKEAMNSFL